MLLNNLSPKKIFYFSLNSSFGIFAEEERSFILVNFLTQCSLIVLKDIPNTLTFTHVGSAKDYAIIHKKIDEIDVEPPDIWKSL